MTAAITILALYLITGAIIAFVFGRKWAAVPWPVVVMVWPWFVGETLSHHFASPS